MPENTPPTDAQGDETTLTAILKPVSDRADALEKHARNMQQRGEIEISVPLLAAVDVLRESVAAILMTLADRTRPVPAATHTDTAAQAGTQALRDAVWQQGANIGRYKAAHSALTRELGLDFSKTGSIVGRILADLRRDVGEDYERTVDHALAAQAAAPISGQDVFDQARAERARAHEKHGERSMESAPWHDPAGRRMRVLVEEVGEVAKELNDAEVEGRPVDGARLAAELIQVAAMAGAWADAALAGDAEHDRSGTDTTRPRPSADLPHGWMR